MCEVQQNPEEDVSRRGSAQGRCNYRNDVRCWHIDTSAIKIVKLMQPTATLEGLLKF